MASFRHGAEALAARLNDDPGTELDRRSPKRPSGSGPVHRHAATVCIPHSLRLWKRLSCGHLCRDKRVDRLPASHLGACLPRPKQPYEAAPHTCPTKPGSKPVSHCETTIYGNWLGRQESHPSNALGKHLNSLACKRNLHTQLLHPDGTPCKVPGSLCCSHFRKLIYNSLSDRPVGFLFLTAVHFE